MPTYVSHCCMFCQKTFDVQIKAHNRGLGKFCSKQCASASLKKDKSHNVKCSLCQSDFYASNKRKREAKSGFLFCSRDCKNKAQAIGSGFDSMLPSHYGSSKGGNSTTYRRIAFDHYPAHCRDCGWNLCVEVLDVHHLDLDRTNNSPENLVILCPTCHVLRHFLQKNGRYSPNNGQ